MDKVKFKISGESILPMDKFRIYEANLKRRKANLEEIEKQN